MKTAKGTELPLIKLKGKDYLEVKYRLVWFREERPDWGIATEIVEKSENHCVVRATIRNDQGRIIATSHKREDAKGFFDFTEKSETGAIGRALALCGYGTQFEPEIEEGERIVDAPAIRPKHGQIANEAYSGMIYNPPARRNRNDLVKELMELYKPFMKVRPHCVFKDLLLERYTVDKSELMTVEQLDDLTRYMKSQIESVK